MRFVTATRNSPWLIRLEGTLALSRVVVKVDAVGRRLVLLAVDKVIRVMSCRIPSGLFDTFQRMTIMSDDFLIC